MTNYQSFYTNRETTAIAKDLLGKVLSYRSEQGVVSGYIVETEAYLGQQDSAAHAFNGRRTAFTEALYGQPGTIYIYQLRQQYMFDVVVQDEGNPQGVLIRGIEPLLGRSIMLRNRVIDGVNLTNGPGKLMQAFGIQSKQMNMQLLENADLTVKLTTDHYPAQIAASTRIGVNANGATGLQPYRFYVAHNPYVSRMKKK
nr:DNA-3-methyladenine glycosylase [Paucilactobacillus hokkaidonensis]